MLRQSKRGQETESQQIVVCCGLPRKQVRTNELQEKKQHKMYVWYKRPFCATNKDFVDYTNKMSFDNLGLFELKNKLDCFQTFKYVYLPIYPIQHSYCLSCTQQFIINTHVHFFKECSAASFECFVMFLLLFISLYGSVTCPAHQINEGR